jgi:acetyl esterase/lipase
MDESERIGMVGGMILFSVSTTVLRRVSLSSMIGVDIPRFLYNNPDVRLTTQPWCDMTDQPGTSAETNKPYDYVSSMGHNAIGSHTRHYPDHLRNPYFSPALPAPDGSHRFGHLVQAGTKVYVQVGTAEALWDQGKMLCRGMEDEGVDVTLREVSCGVSTVVDSTTSDRVVLPLRFPEIFTSGSCSNWPNR